MALRKDVVIGTIVGLKKYPFKNEGQREAEIGVLISKTIREQKKMLRDDGATPTSHSAFICDNVLYVNVAGVKKF